MDLQLKDKLFLVGGATSGLGKAIVEALSNEGAEILAVARTMAKLEVLKKEFHNLEIVVGDLSVADTLKNIESVVGNRSLSGVVINSGGPPAMPAMQTTLEDWDTAYQNVVRWKIGLTQAVLPKMISQGYGRLLFIESVATKQPVENLVLSNAMRLAVTGYVKTLSQEIGKTGVTMNILGPGYHATQRMESLFAKNSELMGIPEQDIRNSFADQTAVKAIGDPKDFASLALWLLSPYSRYVTGQTLTVDGGLVKGVMG